MFLKQYRFIYLFNTNINYKYLKKMYQYYFIENI